MCVTFFVYMCRLCRYLPQPSAKPSIAKVKREARKARGSEGKRGKATQLSCDEHNPRGSEGRKKEKVKSEEGRVKNLREE